MSYIFLRRPQVMCKIEVHEIVLDISTSYSINYIILSDRNKTIYYIQVIFDVIIQKQIHIPNGEMSSSLTKW